MLTGAGSSGAWRHAASDVVTDVSTAGRIDRAPGPQDLPQGDQVDFQIWGVQIVPTIMPYALAPSGVVGLFQFWTFERATTAHVARSCQM